MCSSVGMMAVLVQPSGPPSSQQVCLTLLLHDGFQIQHWCGHHHTCTLAASDWPMSRHQVFAYNQMCGVIKKTKRLLLARCVLQLQLC